MMGNCCCKTRRADFWNTTNAPPSTHTDWMKALDESKSITDISIPGTHESMASTSAIPWVVCQSLSLGDQLQIGIRFFDIRCRLYTDDLLIYQNMFNLNFQFTQCLTDMADFLDKHPSEFLLVRVRDEYKSYHSDKSFSEAVRETLENSKAKLWSEEKVPTIGQAKGKIIILYDFSIAKDERRPIGFPYRSLKWLNTEDLWNAHRFSEKWNAVKTHLETAFSQNKDNQIYLTYNSTALSICTPCCIAKRLNPKLYEYINGQHGRFGIIAMDYPGPKLVEKIINSNHNEN
ncbi:1-phosphatidylinositol phosphodiesterase-like [Mytilus californianus]|uniref:1-phosphatidylinositol phosphodiesterase-like n=1 Tax=Mytilus californianus TaxID=6549 RepID=UPI00224810A7|nr:1-phosphatidylinositol phosphodiesterase-like [Mytilus californianus]